MFAFFDQQFEEVETRRREIEAKREEDFLRLLNPLIRQIVDFAGVHEDQLTVEEKTGEFTEVIINGAPLKVQLKTIAKKADHTPFVKASSLNAEVIADFGEGFVKEVGEVRVLLEPAAQFSGRFRGIQGGEYISVSTVNPPLVGPSKRVAGREQIVGEQGGDARMFLGIVQTYLDLLDGREDPNVYDHFYGRLVGNFGQQLKPASEETTAAESA